MSAKEEPEMEKKLKFIDLFAGCWGLSLVLEQAGFHPVYVNELNNPTLVKAKKNKSGKLFKIILL